MCKINKNDLKLILRIQRRVLVKVDYLPKFYEEEINENKHWSTFKKRSLLKLKSAWILIGKPLDISVW